MDSAPRQNPEGLRVLAAADAPDGVAIRPLRQDDRERVAAAFVRLSDETRRRRFGAVAKRLSRRDLERLTAIDDHGHEALAAVSPGTGEIVGIARYIALPEARQSAEVAVAVADEWQGRGIARRLLAELTSRARAEGVTHVLAYVATENRPVRDWITRVGGVAIDHYGDEILYRMLLESPVPARAAA